MRERRVVGLRPRISAAPPGPLIRPPVRSRTWRADFAMMRAVPGSVVLSPSDAVSAERMVQLAAAHDGVVFIRTARPKTPVLYANDEPFEIGGAKVLRQSDTDAVTVVGTSVTVHEALAAWRFPGSGFEGWARARALGCGLTDPRQVADAVRQAGRLLHRFRTHQLAREMAGADRCLHEVPYSIEVDGRVESGIIDTLYLREGVWTLVEFKTDRIRDEADLERLLEEMADEGLVFVEGQDKGEKKYSLSPFAPGIIEFQTLRGQATEKVKRRLALIKDVHEGLDALAGDLFKNPELANEVLGTPGLRTLAVESELPAGTQIATWEQISEIIEREESFAVGTCACRHEKQLNGDPCKIDAPREACIYFGKVADFMIDRKFAKRFSRQELLALLEKCEEKGLVHNINNFMGDNIVLCNCCGCCCNFLVRMKQYRGLKQVAGSNFVAVVDPESCIGCGDCLDRCQMDALELGDETVRVIEEYCLGCGNCISVCPSESLSLVRCLEVRPPEKPKEIVGLGV